jgi:Cof subfamily protein (haloacid dehalogenase superfamily)
MNSRKHVTAFDKLIAVDLDGTLIGPGNSISAENLSAIRRAIHCKAAVVIATGRAYVSADAVARLIGLPPVPVVAFNGALIRWTGGGDILHNRRLPADLAAEVVDECLQQQLHLHYYLDDEMYVSQDNHWSQAYCERAGMDCRVVPDMQQFAGREPIKLLVIDYPDKIVELLPRCRERWQNRLYVTRSMLEYLEFLSPLVSKGHALNWLIEFFGIRREDTLAIGDSMNDLPLLQNAGHAAAMPGSEDEVRRIAQFVPPSQSTGVAAAIDWFLDR